jgi:16S rRNA G966 N2-methylase RsmD
MRVWYGFSALPAYLGGKRRLAPLILALLEQLLPQREWRGKQFLDPFLGGGAVSLYAKAQGFNVACNDLALRSAVIGRGLIANSSVRLSPGDISRLLSAPEGDIASVVEQRFSPSVFPKAHARLLDRTLHNLQGFKEPRRSLATILVIKMALRVQPMSQLRGTDAKAAYEGDLDKVSSHRVKHYLNAQRLLRPEAWLRLMKEVNTGVFAGNGEAEHGDAFTFLYRRQGDVVYLDPPYPGTTSYEREYAVLDDLLEGQTKPVSGFSRSPDLLGELFQVCAHIPIWLVSLNNAALELIELEELIRAHRPNVRSVEVPYRHLGSIASKEKNARNREFIVLAW